MTCVLTTAHTRRGPAAECRCPDHPAPGHHGQAGRAGQSTQQRGVQPRRGTRRRPAPESRPGRTRHLPCCLTPHTGCAIPACQQPSALPAAVQRHPSTGTAISQSAFPSTGHHTTILPMRVGVLRFADLLVEPLAGLPWPYGTEDLVVQRNGCRPDRADFCAKLAQSMPLPRVQSVTRATGTPVAARSCRPGVRIPQRFSSPSPGTATRLIARSVPWRSPADCSACQHLCRTMEAMDGRDLTYSTRSKWRRWLRLPMARACADQPVLDYRSDGPSRRALVGRMVSPLPDLPVGPDGRVRIVSSPPTPPGC